MIAGWVETLELWSDSVLTWSSIEIEDVTSCRDYYGGKRTEIEQAPLEISRIAI